MKNILIFLSTGFELMEFSPFIDIFGWNKTLNKDTIRVDVTSLSKEVKSSWGIDVNQTISLENLNLEDYSTLILPGGFGSFGFFKDTDSKEFAKILNHFNENNKYIVGVCTGAIPLAELGVLKDKRCTTYLLENKRYYNQLEKWGALPVEENVVIDDNIITSSNPASAVNVAFKLLRILTTKEKAEKISKSMGY